jgi:hypothetical protein
MSPYQTTSQHLLPNSGHQIQHPGAEAEVEASIAAVIRSIYQIAFLSASMPLSRLNRTFVAAPLKVLGDPRLLVLQLCL